MKGNYHAFMLQRKSPKTLVADLPLWYNDNMDLTFWR